MRATTTQTLLYILLLCCLGCAAPEPISLRDIKLPDPEGELAKHLGITAIEEVGICDYFPNSTFDEAASTYFDEQGQKLMVIYAYPDSYQQGFMLYRLMDGWSIASQSRPVDAWCGLSRSYLKHASILLEDSSMVVEDVYDIRDLTEPMYTARYFYNGKGHVINMQDPWHSMTCSYDNDGRLLQKVETPKGPIYHSYEKPHIDESERSGFRTRNSRYYYRNETGPLLDSIVSVLTDAEDKVRWDSYTKYFDEKGYPVKKVFFDGRIYKLNLLELDITKDGSNEISWEYYDHLQERAKNDKRDTKTSIDLN